MLESLLYTLKLFAPQRINRIDRHIINCLYHRISMINDNFVVLFEDTTPYYHTYRKIIMYKKLIVFLAAISIFAVSGCKNQNSEEKAPVAAPAAAPQNTNTLPAVDPDKLARDKARSQQLLAEGRIIPPRAEIIFKAGKIDGSLSVEDAERSYLFKKSAVRRCYMNELAYHSDAKGEVKAVIRYEAQQKAVVVDYTSAIQSEEFNKCLNEAISTWPLPQGVTLEVTLDFSSKPAPTLEEIRNSNRGLHGHDHGHDHDHLHQNDLDHDHTQDGSQDNVKEFRQ